jgi:invasion protein IalB
VAEVAIEDNLLEKLRGGQTATFIVFLAPEEGLGFPLNLKGFGERVDSLSATRRLRL